MKKDNEIFATNLKYHLRKNHMTQKDLARKLDISYSTVNSWARGVFLPSADKLNRVAKALGVTTDKLTTAPENRVFNTTLSDDDFDENNYIGENAPFVQCIAIISNLSLGNQKRALAVLKAMFDDID